MADKIDEYTDANIFMDGGNSKLYNGDELIEEFEAEEIKIGDYPLYQIAEALALYNAVMAVLGVMDNVEVSN